MTKNVVAKQILKYFGRVLLGMLIFVWLVIAFVNTTPVQSFMAAKVADYFSKEWNTKVKIGALSVTPFINAGIKDIYIEDLNKDTLLYAEYIQANLSEIPTGPHVVVKDVLLTNAVCHLNTKNKQFNFQFIIDYFATNEPKPKKDSKPFVLEVKDLQLHNVNFALYDLDKPQSLIDGIFSPNAIICNDINMRVKDFKMNGTDMQANILHLETKERCGIALNEFYGQVKFSKKGIELKDAIIKTNDSFLDCDVSMQTTDFHTYSSFIDSVYCTLNLKQGSYADLKDACYWNENITGAKQRVYISCDVKGTVSDMIIKKMDIRTSQTNINAYGRITGLPNVNNTIFNLNINDLTTSIADYKKMNLGTLIPNLTLPDMLAKLGIVNIMGDFQGQIDNFSSSLTIATDLGFVDLKAKAITQNNNSTKYVADIFSPRINVGTLLDNQVLGNTSLDAQAEILGTNPQTMSGSLMANLRNCYFNGNNYNDISVEGEINGYDISAKARIEDELVSFTGNCSINYEGKPTLSLDADIMNLDLHKMNLLSFADTSTIITAKIQGNIDNLDLEHLNCDATINDIYIKTSTKAYTLNNLKLMARNLDSINRISLTSDIIDANVFGKYTFNSLSDDINYLLTNYIPDFSIITADSIQKNAQQDKNNQLNKEDSIYNIQSNIDFNVNVKSIDLVRSLFDLNLYLVESINLMGNINANSFLSCSIDIPQIQYSNMTAKETSINVQTLNNVLNLNLNSGEFALSDSLILKDIDLKTAVTSNTIDLSANLSKSDDSLTNASINLNTIIDSNGLQGNFENTKFNIQGTTIEINENHFIGILAKRVSLINFTLSSDNSSITIDGAISDNDILHCNFDNVDLSLANPFISSMGMTIEGTLNKNVVLKNISQAFTFTSNLEIEDLKVNDILLGRAWLNVDNNIYPDIFNTNIKFLYQTENKDIIPLQVIGFIAPNNKQEQLDLKINMQDLSLGIIKTFISSFVSDVEGTLSCENLKVKGKLTAPDIQGTIHCNNAAMKVNMLNTKYWLNDNLVIQNNKVVFQNFALKDSQGNKITINGNIAHHNFSSFEMNLNAVADKIKILDTKAGNGEMYYGTAYASANVNLVGDSNMINIYGSAKTEPGTSLTIPVTSKENAIENDFITFINPNEIKDSTSIYIRTETETQSMGYNINLDLNVNPNAKLYIPMDFTQLKGNLTATGNGDLKIAMNSDGKFSMIGEVAIDNGVFGFNIMDIMEKKFILQQGGTLTWNGDPAGGILNVAAIYKTKASLASILGNENNKPVDVESIIRLSGVMTNPQPSFDINLPNTDEQTAEQVFMYIDRSNEKSMLEQTASLLLTNQFYYSQGGYESNALQTGVTSSVMGVAFSQLTGIINNMIKIVDIDLNYTSSASGTATSDQVNAAFSKSIGKWRAELNTSFGGTSQSATTNDGSQIIGDASLKYKYNDNLDFEVFNHSNANDFTKYNISPYTQGARVTYKKEYEKLTDIFRRKKTKKLKHKN